MCGVMRKPAFLICQKEGYNCTADQPAPFIATYMYDIIITISILEPYFPLPRVVLYDIDSAIPQIPINEPHS